MAAVTDTEEIILVLTHAIEQQEAVCILYSKEPGTASARVILPSRMWVTQKGEAVVATFDSIHQTARTFKVEGIKQAHLIDVHALLPPLAATAHTNA